MGRNRKTYSESFKKQVAIEAMDEKRTVAEVAASNNIAPGMVSAWKKAFINGKFSKDFKKTRSWRSSLTPQHWPSARRNSCLNLFKKSESQGYELVDEDSAEKCLSGFWGLSISEQCNLLNVSRSGYYNSLEALHATEADLVHN